MENGKPYLDIQNSVNKDRRIDEREIINKTACLDVYNILKYTYVLKEELMISYFINEMVKLANQKEKLN